MKYRIVYEARKQGAISIYEPHEVEVAVPDGTEPTTARDIARQQLTEQQLETRFPIFCEEVSQ